MLPYEWISKVSEKKPDKKSSIMLFHLYTISRIGKSRKIDSRLVVIKG